MTPLRITLALLLMAGLCLGQVASARLEGTVEDSTGAVIPGSKVTAVNNRTQSRADATASPEGQFTFASLQPGMYTLSVEAPGFRKAVVSNLELTAGATLAQKVKLEVGQVTESVVVEASAVRVETSDAQVARAVTLRDIDTLPQLGRAPITLAVFQPGVQTNPGDVSYSRINGLRQGSNNSKLDGIDVNDSVVPRLGLSMTANNTDSIGEFRIVLGGGKAEYGRNAGGQVELITRSGSNQFHGNAFEYLRNTELNANDFFNNQSGVLRPKFIQNILGGSFGGRIIKEKTFIFGNYQGRRTAQETVRNRTVYTPLARQGIFQYKVGGALQQYNFAAADPRKLGVDKAMAGILARTPLPNNYDLGDGMNYAGFRFNNPSGSREDQYTIKGDHNLTSTNHVFMRWSWMRTYSIDALNSADAPFPGLPQGNQGGHRWGFSIGDDWVIKPTLVNEFRIGYQRANVDFVRPGRLKGPSISMNNQITNPDDPAFAQGRWSPVIDLTENLTWIRGKHVFKMGASYRRTVQHDYNDQGIYPDVTLTTGNGNSVPTSIGPAGLSAADRSTFDNIYNDMMGRVNNVAITYYSDLQKFLPEGASRVRDYNFKEGGFFFQDDWKVTKRLTFNLGVRYEYFPQPTELNTLQGAFDQAANVNGMTQINNLKIQRSNQWFTNDWNNFAPRVGFAWDVEGDGKTAVRGNYGIFYDRMMGTVAGQIDGATPGFSTSLPNYVNSTGTDIRVSDNPKPTAAPAAPVTQLPLTRSTSTTLFVPNLCTGYVQSYSLNVQREIFRNTVLDVGFVANRGLKLFLFRDVNQQKVFGNFLTAFKELQAFNAGGTAPSPNNSLVKIFGTPAAAITGLGGATNFTRGVIGTAANTLDVTNYGRYAAAGVSDFYIRNYPQFNQVRLGTNDGRSYYDSLQISLRRSAGALRTSLNYTFSKAIDNVGAYSTTSSAPEGNGFASPIDNMNLRLMRGVADFNHTHVFNGSGIYSLPIGKGKRFGAALPRWADSLIGGWDIGALMLWQSGTPFTVMSQRATVAITGNSWANFSGDKGVGSVQRLGNGVFFLASDDFAKFTFPGAGEYGNSGRNSFTNPRFFNVDASLVKRFKLFESHSVTFRAEAYNLFNNPNFGGMSINMNTPATFGKFSSTLGVQGTTARTMQLTLRYDF